VTTSRRGEINLVKIVMALGFGAGVYWVYAFLPNQWTALKMGEVTQVTLLYWRDHPASEAKVHDKYNRELDIREVDISFEPDWCQLYDYSDELHMECWWDYTVDVPLLGPKVQEFYIHKYVDSRTGEIYDISEES